MESAPIFGEVINAINGELIILTNTSSLSEEEKSDENLKSLLNDFKLEAAFDHLKAAQVTYESLRYLRNEDLKEAIPPLGLRVQFREKLFTWKKQTFGVGDDTVSLNLSNTNCLDTSETSNNNISACFTYIKKDLVTLLTSTTRGNTILNVYKKFGKLDDTNREDLIALLVEELRYNNISLKPKDFPCLVHEICSIFPSELHAKEYYYIPREGKKNPSGKLYYKFVNCRRGKRQSLNTSRIDEKALNTTSAEVIELDDSIVNALKTALSRESTNWNEVCDKWAKTFQARQYDVKNLTSVEFFKAWPKLLDSRAPELIQIDFNLLYPSKQDLLYSSWEHFKLHIVSFYEARIHNENCKQLFLLAKTTTNIDTQDCLISTLLVSVLQTSSRFVNTAGKCTKKITIADAQESFILRLESVNDYQRRVDEIICKYYSAKTTVQPFLMVWGLKLSLEVFMYISTVLYTNSTHLLRV